jgi:hypothetical protein
VIDRWVVTEWSSFSHDEHSVGVGSLRADNCAGAYHARYRLGIRALLLSDALVDHTVMSLIILVPRLSLACCDVNSESIAAYLLCSGEVPRQEPPIYRCSKEKSTKISMKDWSWIYVSMRHSRQHVLVHLSKSAQYRELCGARMQHGQDKLTVICSRGGTGHWTSHVIMCPRRWKHYNSRR